MTNFEFFKDKCQNTEVFAYHIYYKDGRFESKRDEQLNNISEEDILYFEGFYEVGGYLEPVDTFANLPFYGIIVKELNSTFRVFGINMLYRLDQLGVEQYLIRNLYSTLFKEYVIEEKRLGEDYYEEFLDIWNNEYEDVLREWGFLGWKNDL